MVTEEIVRKTRTQKCERRNNRHPSVRISRLRKDSFLPMIVLILFVP
jgi:hypothetical protein